MTPPDHRPTPAQLAVLERLAAGERLEWHAGLGRFMGPYYSFGLGKHVHANTVHALKGRGWIRAAKGGDLRTMYYELTDTGRAALDAHGHLSADGPQQGKAAAR